MFRPLKAGALLLLCALITSIAVAPASAAHVKMRSFNNTYSDGAYPVGQMAAIGSTLYGVTQYGVAGAGSIYKMTTAGATSPVAEFAGGAASPHHPTSGLTVAGGALYGTSLYGGAHGFGSLYKATTAGVVTILHSFDATAPKGFYPQSGLTLDSGGTVLYGTTLYGGANNHGTIYSINVNGTGYQTLYSFDASTEGYYPYMTVCEGPDGKLYGTTFYAAGGNGFVYRVNKNGTGFTTLHTFSGGALGDNPLCDLVKAKDNKLYGTSLTGGDDNFGTVFRVNTATGDVEPVASLNGYNGATPGMNYGNYPQYRLTVGASTSNLLYGVSSHGGLNSFGTIFKVDGTANTISLLANFTETTSKGHANPMTLIGTTLYGTSYYGGTTALSGSGGNPDGFGSAFSCAITGTFKNVHNFYILEGHHPRDAPTVAIGGYLYGTTQYGGQYGSGTVYKIAATGAYAHTTLLSFNNNLHQGIAPIGGLYKAADGALYGCTTGGGFYGYGTIYKITTTGAITIIRHFRAREGISAERKLVQGFGLDKNLYGVCYTGGAGGYGTIFKTSTSGVFSIIRHFSLSGGTYPSVQLTVHPDTTNNTTKWLYGLTYQGGANSYGTLFRVNPSGSAYSVLHDFAGSPDSANAGYYNGPMYLNTATQILYGTSSAGGVNGQGTIFQYDTVAGAYSVIYSFDDSAGDGANPFGGVVSDGSGFLYGTNGAGGASGQGTIWKYNVGAGSLLVLKSFAGTAVGGDGTNPNGVVYDQSGLLYGTTYGRGAYGYGTIFSQTLVP